MGQSPAKPTRRTAVEPLEPRIVLSSVALVNPVSTPIALGDFPIVATASGDLNGDGIPDLIANADNLQAQVFLGTKTGAFSPSLIYATGGDFLALGDFTNSGKLALATADGIYKGNGDGTFGAIIGKPAIPTNTVKLYAEDVNGDGNLDLVAVTYTAGTGTGAASNATISLDVFLGKGDGTFQTAITTPIGSAPNLTQADATSAFGDFNNDGKLDVVTELGVMLGNGDGTFQKPAALPFTTSGSGMTALPAAPLFAVGDFNGDGNLDLLTIPAKSNSGAVELFLGTGRGTFTDAGPIMVAAGQTITSLATAVLTSSNNGDLIAGITASAGSQSSTSDLAVLTGSGKGTFAAPVESPVSGPPQSIAAEDFNGDGNLDLLSINGLAGNTTLNGLSEAVSAAVLLNAQPAAAVPVLSLRGSSNPVVAGNTVMYTATVSPPKGSVSAAVPTGSITFLSGTTIIGTATLANGVASLTITASGLGVQSITFAYGGDGNYAGATSAVLSQTVLVTGAKVPLLIPTLSPSVTLPPQFIPGDEGTVTVMIANGGGAGASGKIDVNFYLATSGTVDSSAIALDAPGLQNHAIQLGSGKTTALAAHLRFGSYPPGDYYLVIQVVPVANLTNTEVSSAPVISATTFQAAGLVFGSLGMHHGIILKITDSSGTTATCSISGLGTGTITQANGETNLTVTGTSTSSRVFITSRTAFTLNNVDVPGVLNKFGAHTTTLAGHLNLRGGVNQLNLGSVSGTGLVAINIGTGAFMPTVSLGSVGNAEVTSAGPLKSLFASSWQGGALDATSIANLQIATSFGADIRVHDGGKLKFAKFGSISGGTWSVAGGIGQLRVPRSITGTSIYAGADSGTDDILGTSDDAYGNSSIGILAIAGSITSTLIAAGAAPVSGQTIFTGMGLLPHGSIVHLIVGGSIDSGSRFLSAHLPRIVRLNGARVATATDPHFQV